MMGILLIGLVWPQDTELTGRQDKIAGMVKKLDETLTQLIDKLQARGQTEAVERLKAAQAKLKGEALELRLEGLRAEVEKGNFSAAQDQADSVANILKEIVELLTRASDEAPSTLARLEEQLKEANRLLQRQRKIHDDLLRNRKPGELSPEQSEVGKDTGQLQKVLALGGLTEAADKAADARGSMSRAAGGMSQGSSSDSQRQSGNAVQKLIDLRKLIVAKIALVKSKVADDARNRLAEELSKILDAEKTIRRETGNLDQSRRSAGSLDRSQIAKARRLSEDQISLGKSMEEIRKALGMENVDVYEFVVGLIIEEMGETAGLLKESDVGATAQDFQDSIIRRLTDLIDAFQMPPVGRRPSLPSSGIG